MKVYIEGLSQEYIEKNKIKIFQCLFGFVRMPRKTKKKFGQQWRQQLDSWYLKKIHNMEVRKSIIKGFTIDPLS